MKIVSANEGRLQYAVHNKGIGNLMLHVLFVLKLCEVHGHTPAIPCSSVLDDIFDLAALKQHRVPQNLPVLYHERSVFRSRRGWLSKFASFFGVSATPSIAAVVARSRRELAAELRLLGGPIPARPFTVIGHFMHHQLTPTAATFARFLQIREELPAYLGGAYPDLTAPHAVAVHLRDTDFADHLRHIFPQSIMLDDDYYLRAAQQVEAQLGREVVYHLFSDNPERIRAIFEGRRYVLHVDEAHVDWVAMLMCRNIIQSNSSFCWSASLYNKVLSVQPYCGYNYYAASGPVPCGFAMPRAIQISYSNAKA